MEIKKDNCIRLTPAGYREICRMVDERASPNGYPRCEWCGKTMGIFDHHHIIFRSDRGSDTLENLILLCRNCHEIYGHGHKRQLYQKQFKDYRMDITPIKEWNENHQQEAEKIYRRYKK